MFRNLKRILEMNKSVIAETEEYDEDGRLILNLSVRDDANFLSVFSYDKEAILSTEVADFLTNGIRDINYRHPLHIQIYSNVIDKDKEVIYSNAIVKHFEKDYSKRQHADRRNLALSLIMLLCGVFFLFALYVFQSNNAEDILLEVVDIFAWVFLWESADMFFFQKSINKRAQQKCISFAKAKITYHPLDTLA